MVGAAASARRAARRAWASARRVVRFVRQRLGPRSSSCTAWPRSSSWSTSWSSRPSFTLWWRDKGEACYSSGMNRDDHQLDDGFTTIAVPLAMVMTFAVAAVTGFVFATLASPIVFAVAVWIVPPDPAWLPRGPRRERREHRPHEVVVMTAAVPHIVAR